MLTDPAPRDRLICAIVAAILLLLMAAAHGCTLLTVAAAPDGRLSADQSPPATPAPDGVAVPVTRVPLARDPLPLPELAEEPFAPAAPAPADTPADLATKADLARLLAELQVIKAESAAATYKAQQAARQEAEAARAEADVRLAALEAKLAQETAAAADQARASTYDAREWLWAILAGAIAAIVYAYRRLSLAAAALALVGFAFLFALVLAGQHYPRLVALAPLPFVALTAYAAWRYGVIRRALVACAQAIEYADADAVKRLVRKDPGGAGVEQVRTEIDLATLARAHDAKRRARDAAAPAPEAAP